MSSDSASHHGHDEKRQDIVDDQDVLGVGMQDGVKKVEVLQRVWTGKMKVALFVAIALAR